METKTFMGGFLAGAFFGIGVGILLATSTSEETKQKLVKGAKKITDSFGDAVNDTINRLKEEYTEVVEQVAGKGNATNNTYN